MVITNNDNIIHINGFRDQIGCLWFTFLRSERLGLSHCLYSAHQSGLRGGTCPLNTNRWRTSLSSPYVKRILMTKRICLITANSLYPALVAVVEMFVEHLNLSHVKCLSAILLCQTEILVEIGINIWHRIDVTPYWLISCQRFQLDPSAFGST